MACKNLTNISTKISKFMNVNLLAELFKRLPSNQLEQFVEFRIMCHEYQTRVDKFPEKLPSIDWEYYRTNVRKEYIKMVDDFEKKYEELNKIFDNRSQIDTTKYFKEVDKVKSDVKADVEKYIKDSNERIKLYEQQIEYLRNMIPFEQMTCEDYCILFPHNAHSLGVGDSFWPHTPEEQLGYVSPTEISNEKSMEEGTAEDRQAVNVQQQAAHPKTAEEPHPTTTPSKEKPGTGVTIPKTAEIPQPSPAKIMPDPKKATSPKPKTAEVSHPSSIQEKTDSKNATSLEPKPAEAPQKSSTKEKRDTTSKGTGQKPSTKKRENDQKDDPENDGEKK